MPSTPVTPGSIHEGSAPVSSHELPAWVERAARAGYTAKGVVYAAVGFLAFRQALGMGGDASGTREALREMASAPFGTAIVGLTALGLAGYVLWRLVQVVLDPERQAGEGDETRLARRAFFLMSAVIYGFLAYYAAMLVLGPASSSDERVMLAGLTSTTWGPWLVGAVGVGLIGRGLYQFFKAYTERFRKKINDFELGQPIRKWVIRASRVGLTARGVIFVVIGGSMVYAAWTRDPDQARGLGESLQAFTGDFWLLGALGAGLVGYAVYQWLKARYRLIGV